MKRLVALFKTISVAVAMVTTFTSMASEPSSSRNIVRLKGIESADSALMSEKIIIGNRSEERRVGKECM